MLFFFFEFVLVFFDIELMKCVTKVKDSNLTNTEDPFFNNKCSNFSSFNIHS